jgi:hypothetical protein
VRSVVEITFEGEPGGVTCELSHQDVEGIEVGNRPVEIDEDRQAYVELFFLRVDVDFLALAFFLAGAFLALAGFSGFAAGAATAAAAAAAFGLRPRAGFWAAFGAATAAGSPVATALRGRPRFFGSALGKASCSTASTSSALRPRRRAGVATFAGTLGTERIAAGESTAGGAAFRSTRAIARPGSGGAV